MSLDRLLPSVHKRWLLLLAGVIWMGVSLMLAAFAFSWLRPLPWTTSLPLALVGLAIAAAAYRLGFFKLALRNIRRIQALAGPANILAFQQAKAYFMIILMASGGALLRHSAFPKPILAVVYLAMGGCLFLASLLYYPEAWQLF
ncbi:MAG TPA: hypothetical protein VGA61_09705 [Anaerolineae bacterium]